MRRPSRTFKAIGTVAAALLAALGLNAGAARAASSVEITYDLSDTTLMWEGRTTGVRIPVSNEDPFSANGTVSGSMKLRYTSHSSSGMPIVHGPGTLLTFNLTAKSLSLFHYALTGTGEGNLQTNLFVWVTGTLHWQLTTPVTGSFTSGSGFTGLAANVLIVISHEHDPTGGPFFSRA